MAVILGPCSATPPTPSIKIKSVYVSMDWPSLGCDAGDYGWEEWANEHNLNCGNLPILGMNNHRCGCGSTDVPESYSLNPDTGEVTYNLTHDCGESYESGTVPYSVWKSDFADEVLCTKWDGPGTCGFVRATGPGTLAETYLGSYSLEDLAYGQHVEISQPDIEIAPVITTHNFSPSAVPGYLVLPDSTLAVVNSGGGGVGRVISKIQIEVTNGTLCVTQRPRDIPNTSLNIANCNVDGSVIQFTPCNNTVNTYIITPGPIFTTRRILRLDCCYWLRCGTKTGPSICYP